MSTAPLIEAIKKQAEALYPELVQWRRHLHTHPELSFEEVATSAFVQQKLTEWGITFTKDWVKTGVIASLKGALPGTKTLALRADLDALPIEEVNDVPYKSKHEGIMHACGHDAHTTCLLGAIRILQQLAPFWGGEVRAIFQPGEEKLPGGASLMIAEGALKNPTVNGIFGQHVFPELPAGKVGFRPGMYMASTDEIYITVLGKGGHGALPHQNIDPVTIAAHILVNLQMVVSRNAPPAIPCVLSFGKITANGATNVIPSKVELEGTFRTMDETWRADAHERIRTIAHNTAIAHGATCQVRIEKGYPMLLNNEKLTVQARENAVQYLGAENVVELELRMTAEDFAFYSQQVPACFYRLGTRNEEAGITASVHTPTFDIDEKALEVGAGLMAWQAIQFLGDQ